MHSAALAVVRSDAGFISGDWLESVAVLFNIRHLYSEVKLCVCFVLEN